ncbi:hypothetical protein [Campylobacter vulpis]|uniref:hypothetical protein n=1 Tax=Campylobacter vulpis TaxID=1655500 RepID=UPI000C14E5DD|nr:hypothetical protein [Campylobacter vulpis]MBS4275849.1 hypothetical protein [Campylobacter vulpis]MBS4307188.1 hypothetical protein [Campylobacter vulpis]MBS4314007.1 hypothetical protein [Campylobacter vulpis]MBS4329722.1 hypothetical protein [Campylobacter vulpis]MBS4423766.1 hypothetical protein [Campylobacter vulpis]
MRLLLILFIFTNLLQAEFSQKQIIKMEKEENFELIDLNQNITKQHIDEQKAVFDSSTLKPKKELSVSRDKVLDYGVVFSFNEKFHYFLNNHKVNAKDFSLAFTQKTLHNLRLNFLNSTANGIYQSQKTLQNFSPENAKLVNVAPFLRHEKDKNKLYAQFMDYLIVINLNEFYIELTNYFITQSTSAHANINFKLVSSSKGLIKSKNIRLKLALKDQNTRQNLQSILNEMPQMLAEVIKKETKDLKP